MADEQKSELSFLEKFNAPVSVLWDKYKLFLIVFGVILLIIKFQDVIMDVIVGNSKKLVNDAEKKSDQLKAEENTAKDRADQLVKESKDLSKNKPEVDEDWNKKK